MAAPKVMMSMTTMTMMMTMMMILVLSLSTSGPLTLANGGPSRPVPLGPPQPQGVRGSHRRALQAHNVHDGDAFYDDHGDYGYDDGDAYDDLPVPVDSQSYYPPGSAPPYPGQHSQHLPYKPPQYHHQNCPNCPYLEDFYIKCRKADPLCCVNSTFTDVMDSVYPYADLPCPTDSATTAENICSALESDPSIVSAGTRLIPTARFPSDGDWTSDTYAAVAAIGSANLCFNVYPGVVPGDVLSATCDENDIIGDPTLVLASIARGASISTGGSLVISTPQTAGQGVTLTGAMIVMGDIQVLESPAMPIFFAMVTPFTGPGPFSGLGFVAAGDIQFASSLNAAVEFASVNSAQFTDADFEDFFNAGVPTTVISQEVAESYRQQFDAFLCSAFNQLLALTSNAEIAFAGTAMTVNCNGGGTGGQCVGQMTAEQLSTVTSVALTINAYEDIIVKVTGTGSHFFLAPNCDAPTCEHLLFFFTQADAINVVIQPGATVATPVMPVFAPVSTSINFHWDLTGTPPSSANTPIIASSRATINLTSAGTSGAAAEDSTAWVLPDVSINEVVLCSCDCDPADLPVAVDRKKCVKDLRPYGKLAPITSRY